MLNTWSLGVGSIFRKHAFLDTCQGPRRICRENWGQLVSTSHGLYIRFHGARSAVNQARISGWRQATSWLSTPPTPMLMTWWWQRQCRNTTGKSSVLRFYLHKMMGLTASRSKRRPCRFSLRISLFFGTSVLLLPTARWYFDSAFGNNRRQSLSRMQMKYAQRNLWRKFFLLSRVTRLIANKITSTREAEYLERECKCEKTNRI